MDTHQALPDTDRQAAPPLRTLLSPPRFITSASAGSHRRIAIAVDLSDESAYAVRWAVQNYLRPGDAVILLHVRPTSVLYGADWGAVDLTVSVSVAADDDDAANGRPDSHESQRKMEEDFDAFTTTKAQDLAQPLVEAQIPFKIRIVKDHDMKERLCLEVERWRGSALARLSWVAGDLEPPGASARAGSGASAIIACITAFAPLWWFVTPMMGRLQDLQLIMERAQSQTRWWRNTWCRRTNKSSTMLLRNMKMSEKCIVMAYPSCDLGSDKEHKPWRKANSCVSSVAVVASVI